MSDTSSLVDVSTITSLSGTTLNSAQSLTFAAAASITDSSLTASGITLSFPVLTALGRTNLTASAGGEIAFPVATSYSASGDGGSHSIQANGAGSRIDLSHLTTLTGGTYYNLAISAATGGEIDLAGAVTAKTSLSLFDASSILDVSGVSSLQDTNVTTSGGVLNFAVLTTLRKANLTANGGGTIQPKNRSYPEDRGVEAG